MTLRPLSPSDSAVYNLLNLNHVPIQINYESKPVIMIRFNDYAINYPVDLLSNSLDAFKA